MTTRHRKGWNGSLLAPLPVEGHRMSLGIVVRSGKRRASCECGWVGPDRDTAKAAADQWRDHVGIVA